MEDLKISEISSKLLLIFPSHGIYIVEGHEKARSLTESIPYISKMAIGNAGMECRNSKKIPPFSPPPFPER